MVVEVVWCQILSQDTCDRTKIFQKPFRKWGHNTNGPLKRSRMRRLRMRAALIKQAMKKRMFFLGRKHSMFPKTTNKHGTNGAASNDGSLIKWENVPEMFGWKRKKRQTVECCKKILVNSTGRAGVKQWDRLGLYYNTGQILHGRMVYHHENRTQSIFYILGEFDGWLLGPAPNVNYGGIKNYHDGMCVHTSNVAVSRNWGYYDGPQNTKNPEEAFPHWKYNDETLSVSCVSKVVNIDSKKIPDTSRGPMLRKLYRRAGPLLREQCGPPLLTGKLNMDAWIVLARCGGDCHRNNITLQLDNGKADILIVAAQSELDLPRYCFRCHSSWSGRLLSGETASWSTAGPGMSFRLYVIIVGYDDYVSLSIRIDSDNLVEASSHKLK
eukprot:GFUD01020352.1.p1 GENE.GFUD01020352.1~~GFUD01020352.1.p1  ORF type:complete len:382 (-),score=64.82 GFUD01020352.1:299-1444(-)